MYEPTWSQPLTDWQPTASFRDTAIPPAAGPTSGTLVQLPCVNEDWLPLILGAIDQLRNPATWLDTLSDAARDAVLGQVDYLRSLIGEALNVPCCSYELRFTSGCVLQFSTDGGTTWNDVTGWDANFANCVSGVIIPPVPPNPGHDTTSQHACNIAGYLATKIIQQTMQNAVTAFNAGNDLVDFAQGVLDLLAYAFPITYYATNAFFAFYRSFNSGNISDFTSASTDATLWGEVTCAIYAAIATDGYITAANYPTVVANICGLSYTHPEVITALCAFVTAIGLQNLQAMQQVGVMDTVDCSGCSGSLCIPVFPSTAYLVSNDNTGAQSYAFGEQFHVTTSGLRSDGAWVYFPVGIASTFIVYWYEQTTGALIDAGSIPAGISGRVFIPWDGGTHALISGQSYVVCIGWGTSLTIYWGPHTSLPTDSRIVWEGAYYNTPANQRPIYPWGTNRVAQVLPSICP